MSKLLTVPPLQPGGGSPKSEITASPKLELKRASHFGCAAICEGPAGESAKRSSQWVMRKTPSDKSVRMIAVASARRGVPEIAGGQGKQKILPACCAAAFGFRTCQ